MTTTFHRFPDLPAELRVRVWHVALEDDYEDLNGRNRIVKLHSYSPPSNSIAVALSRRYPTLFEVNREARYEAAKAEGGEWVTVRARSIAVFQPQKTHINVIMIAKVNAQLKSRYASKNTSSFKMYMSFSQDILFISSRFVSYDDIGGLPFAYATDPENVKLQILINVLSYSIIEKVVYFMLSTKYRPNLSKLGCKGTLLELFTALKRIHLHSVIYSHFLHATRDMIYSHLRQVWEKLGAEGPYVSSLASPILDDLATMTWLYESGIIDVESDGIRTVEWGSRKDLWVPRAKKGSATLQKTG
jgi:hypothetical protein